MIIVSHPQIKVLYDTNKKHQVQSHCHRCDCHLRTGRELSLEEVAEMMFQNLSSRDSPGAARLGQRAEVNFGPEQLAWTIMIR